MADYADDAAALLSALGWDGAIVVGVSFGGMVAQEIALRHPELVQRLVLCCTSSGGGGGSSYPLHDLPDLAPEALARFRMSIMDKRRDEVWHAARPDEAAAVLKPMVAAMLARQADPVAGAGFRRQIEARAGHDTYDRLPELNVPTLVCGGRYDGQAEPAVVTALAKRIPDAELEFFEGGHAFLAQDPAAWERIGAFLAEGAVEVAGR
jgi:3-oxoadipate enol-lactonase